MNTVRIDEYFKEIRLIGVTRTTINEENFKLVPQCVMIFTKMGKKND